jgi:hypothetical protein
VLFRSKVATYGKDLAFSSSKINKTIDTVVGAVRPTSGKPEAMFLAKNAENARKASDANFAMEQVKRIDKEGGSSREISQSIEQAFKELNRNLNDSIAATQARLNQAKKDKDLRGADKEQRNLDNLIRTIESLFKAPRKDPKTGEILEEGGSAGKARKGLRQAIEMENKIKKGEIASTRPANVRPVGGGGQSVQGIPSAQQTPQASSGGIAGQASPQPMQVQMPDISQMSGEDCCSKLTALIRLTEKGNQLLSAHPKGTGAAGTGAGSNDETIHLNKRPPDQRFERRDKKDRRPRLADLRDSGAIEQDADVVAFLYRDSYYDKNNSEENGETELIVAKQRDGNVGSYKLWFDKRYQRFLSEVNENVSE